jgi:hypothetical protein
MRWHEDAKKQYLPIILHRTITLFRKMRFSASSLD